MSKENLDIVRQVRQTFNRGDMEALLELFHPDVELDWSRRLLDPVVIRGYEEMRRFFDEVSEVFGQIRFEEPMEEIDFGDHVLMVSHARFKGRASGADVLARAANFWTIRDGKIALFRLYQTKEEALADLEQSGIWPPAPSSENLEIIRSVMNQPLSPETAGWNDVFAPDIEVHDHDIPDAGTYRGAEGVARWMQDWGQAWGDFSAVPEEFLAAGDQVVAVVRLRATGKGSGVVVERQDGLVWTMRDGKAIRLDYYNNRADALKAAGLH